MDDPILEKNIPLGGLISIIYRSRNIDLNNSMKNAGLSSGQFFVLLTLSREENIPQEKIAKFFHMDKGTVARAVRKLEDLGYVCKRPDPQNRRVQRLFLTPDGREIIPGIIEIVSTWEQKVCEGFPDFDVENLYSMLRIICSRSLGLVSENEEVENAG